MPDEPAAECLSAGMQHKIVYLGEKTMRIPRSIHRAGITIVGVVMAVTAASASAALASDLTGHVLDASGKAIPYAWVTAKNLDKKMATSVLTDEGGAYRVPDLFAGKHSVSVHRIGFNPVEEKEFDLPFAGTSKDFSLPSRSDFTEQLPGNQWVAALPDSPYKARFAYGCTPCHDIGSPVVRKPRSVDEWVPIIKVMRETMDVYGSIPSFDNRQLASWLVENHFGKKVVAKMPPFPTAKAAKAVITEYDVGGPMTWAHDMAVEPTTGAAWFADYVNDMLIRIDPRTNAQEVYPYPAKGAGAHTLHFDKDGLLWTTLQLTDEIASFNPRTKVWRVYGGLEKGSQVHSFAYDSFGLIKYGAKGLIWVSQYHNNAISSLDPKTGNIEQIKLPVRPVAQGHENAYGIAIDTKGRIWYSQIGGNSIGMYDPATGKHLTRDMPRPDAGPHRLDIDDQDRLWIPASGYSKLVMYNINEDTFTEYDMPDPDTIPYTLRVDGATGKVWITANEADSLYLFDPKTKTFEIVRLPGKLSYGRMVSIDYSNGSVWIPLSSFPNKQADRENSVVVRVQMPR